MNEDSSNLIVLVTRLDDVREDIRDLRSDITNHRTEMVSRGEWEMRNLAVDSRFENQGRELSEIKAARAPWWTWVGVMISLASLAWVLLGGS